MRPGGQPNMQQIMKQAQKMQQQVAQAQAELAEAELTGTAGGGLVTVVVTGLGEYKSVKIDPKAVDAEDVEGDPLGALRAHAREPPQLVDQVLDGAFVHEIRTRGGRGRRGRRWPAPSSPR